jgi:hypothetical protein
VAYGGTWGLEVDLLEEARDLRLFATNDITSSNDFLPIDLLLLLTPAALTPTSWDCFRFEGLSY